MIDTKAELREIEMSLDALLRVDETIPGTSVKDLHINKLLKRWLELKEVNDERKRSV